MFKPIRRLNDAKTSLLFRVQYLDLTCFNVRDFIKAFQIPIDYFHTIGLQMGNAKITILK